MTDKSLPLILVLDDLFGRNVEGERNVDRENLCAQFLWLDVTGDASSGSSNQAIKAPVAEALFHRAQLPLSASVGDTVNNDPAGALQCIGKHWWPQNANADKFQPPLQGQPRLSMVLLDLCFYTGKVTPKSHRYAPGMPEGRSGDSDPTSYFGLTLLEEIQREFPELPVFALSSMPRQPVAMDLIRRGVLGFIDRTAPEGPEQFAKALIYHGLFEEQTGEIIGQSLPLMLALREARRAALLRQDVLIHGERGSGKELFAQLIHRMTADSCTGIDGPMVVINIPLMQPALFAAEIFGIESGSSPGVEGRIGLLEAANHGDVFLDEIATMAPEVQASLLRVLQEREITPVGGRLPRHIDIRIISATNTPLEQLQAMLRPDLQDRLRAGSTIYLPPLRDRPTDIPLLVERFLREAESRSPATMQRDVTEDALAKLLAYAWPGNVRELQSSISDAVSRFPDVEHLVADHLRLSTGLQIQKIYSIPTHLDPPLADVPGNGTNNILLESLIHQASAVQFTTENLNDWAGKLGVVQALANELIARMIQASLDATRRRTPADPVGVVQIHPAVKLLTGNASITATQAADAMKRLLGPMAETLEGDLKQAYEIAVRLRPKRQKLPVLSDQ